MHSRIRRQLAAALCLAGSAAAVACGSSHDQPPAAVKTEAARPAVPSAPAGIPVNAAEVIHSYPHDPAAFTEGLEWYDGHLYESTGIEGRSGVRRTDLTTGTVVSSVQMSGTQFGEGITVYNGLLYELTWRGGMGFRYDAHSLAKRGSFTYTGEGWGMTHDEHSLIISDGTNVLRYLDPKTMQVQRALSVSAEGMPLVRLNELERIHGEIWANVWQAPQIARIDPATGHVIGWIDLAALVPPSPVTPARDTVDVANGIAYDSAGDRIFVTGKFWPVLYQIRLGARQ
jgi:glutaminyl-peptide cyclotransferase